MKLIGTVVHNRDGFKFGLLLFSWWLDGNVSRYINLCTWRAFTSTSVRDLQFKRKFQIACDYEKNIFICHRSDKFYNKIHPKNCVIY